LRVGATVQCADTLKNKSHAGLTAWNPAEELAIVSQRRIEARKNHSLGLFLMRNRMWGWSQNDMGATAATLSAGQRADDYVQTLPHGKLAAYGCILLVDATGAEKDRHRGGQELKT
jgi:hypothetical protein